MARPRKKRMKLPNGFGSIKYLGDNRRRPDAVYPPAEIVQYGPKSPKALAYSESWEDAYELLTAYNMEKKGQIKVNQSTFIDRSPTFKEVYERFYKEKYENPHRKKLSESSKRSTRAAYLNCSILHDKQISQIRYDDLQGILDNCTLSHSSQELIVSLMHQIYKYAIKYDIVEKDYSANVFIPIEDNDESGVPFTEEEMQILWNNKDDKIVQFLLIMCYSGWRISEFLDMEINLKEGYFRGGIKTAAGKDRIVPIHSGIKEFVQSREYTGKNFLGCVPNYFRKDMYEKLDALGILYAPTGEKPTPHDCRHTFSMFCERYKVSENDRKRMLGHSFGTDVTNAVYGHRTAKELSEEIEKIKIPYNK